MSICFFLVFCLLFNAAFSKIFHVPTNFESAYISALILSLIVSPPMNLHGFITLGWISLWTIASKYLITIKRKLIFNPVAFGVFMSGIGLSQFASWWVGTAWMLPFVLIGGLLVVKKIQRVSMVTTFIFALLLTTSVISAMYGSSMFTIVEKALFETPLFFFACVMLTEPLTTPPTKKLQVVYGAIVGFFASAPVHIGPFYTSPEIGLLIGNLFSFIVSPKIKLILSLKHKGKVSSDIMDFVFSSSDRFSFIPGQYMEWTLAQPHPDSRGNRRYFTLASSPTEHDVIIGVRFNQNGSTFKNQLASLSLNDHIIAGQIAGDFTLPTDKYKKLVFIAGGIGVTPFRSMIKFLIDQNEKRDITILYTAKNSSEFAYSKLFSEAQDRLGIKVIYTITGEEASWKGRRGRIDQTFIKEVVPEYHEAIYYISGPNVMVNNFTKIFKHLGIKKSNIKTDFFPGFA